MMEAGEDERRILRNVEQEPCVHSTVETDFFAHLAAKGVPSRADQAKSFGYQVVQSDPNRFVCQGRQVPPGRFEVLLRLEQVSSLRWRLPEEELGAKGLRDRDLADDVSEEDLRSVTDEYDGVVRLGNALQIVWATELTAVQSSPADQNLNRLSDRLGLGRDRYILCVYNRGQTRSLHVPRALDAIDHPRFRVVLDCSADHGWTHPTTGPPEEALPEAVHRDCTVVPVQWGLGQPS